MKQDVVKELGLLALGTRLKRIGERLQSQTQAVLASAGITTPASHFPLLAALDRLGSMNVGDLADVLGVSQPGVTRQVSNLQAEGLVQAHPSPDDLRSRTVELTKAGRQLVARAKRSTWPTIEAAVTDACAADGRSLLALLTALEQALADESLCERADRLKSGGKRDAST
ncbi:MAG TPA: MarR family transcriptional regulator [Ideonella sp.]|uniref:MarR family winged helix-turn-helix transcriptional regulator n=1 Tax=Ideonella sp. TaxID=1929293 RepID=UPI002E319124|nr:MarR family transcriptional regulator [Ideonella sp.]HEX5683428.1 MarR family transcriptional regulator [Ideonella sp.]